MNNQLLTNKKSLIIGIFLILGIALTIVLVRERILTMTSADLTTTPQKVQITNITDTSFTVVFTTGLSTTAALQLPEGSTGNTIILDDRDKSSREQNSYFSHHITVPNLQPQNTYNFRIISDGQEYSSSDEYIVTTGPEIDSQTPSQNPLSGKVILPDGSIGRDTIVVANTENSQLISTVTNNEGNYTIPTNSLRSESLAEYIELEPQSQIFLDFFRETYSAKITANYQLGQNLPTITLNHVYSFSSDEEESIGTSSAGLQFIEETPESTTDPSVTSPEEGQSFVDQQPLFSGVGGPDRTVSISISQLGINESVDISAQGRWSFRPEDDLPQGDYNAVFDVPDSNGINERITRNFSILASGSQVSQSATPSATPTFTPTPTEVEEEPTATPTPTPSSADQPTATPTISTESTPTPTPSSADQPTATPTIIPTSTPIPPIDDPGSFSSTIMLGAFSIILIVAGAAIFFAL